MFEMAGAVRYRYRGSWCAEGLPTAWEGQWRAVGRRGSATWDGTTAPVAETVSGEEGFLRQAESSTGEVRPLPGEDIEGSLREFLHALETGETPMGECHDNIKSLAMVLAAVESARVAARVKVVWE
jgi:predicted dehydrogenase